MTTQPSTPVDPLEIDPDRLYAVNDALSALAADLGAMVPDDDLNDLTHYVYRFLEERHNR